MNESLTGRLLAAGMMTLLVHASQAAVTTEEAKQLGSSLTEFGSEKAGNADGSIPAYTGGLAKVSGYDPKTSTHYVDPFKDEKPLYSVTVENMARYDALLAPGTKVLIKTYPGYRIDVYPSHRTVRYTSVVLQNTVKNATTAKMAGAVEGDAIEGNDKGNLPYAGISFPIPKNGYEAMWNNTLHFSAAVNQFSGAVLMIDSMGNLGDPTRANVFWLHPWYDTKGTLRAQTFESIFGLITVIISPLTAAGTGYLAYYPANAAAKKKAWFYLPVLHRIRPAPDFAYDIPVSGAIFWDEISGFLGRMDRFDFKLAGKKEMLVPYNVFGVINTVLEKDFIGNKFVNPDAVRWEKHRVWVVDSTRKPTASHVYARRTFYIDEDCWCITQTEAYDSAGNILRVAQFNNFPSYITGGINVNSWTNYDFVKGGYYIFNAGYANEGRSIHDYDTAEGLSLALTPQSIAGSGAQ